ncbi:methyltransferase domain-containing protein [Streptomyces atratus]|uniref:methyltransferase domain-containing protein n=1 Tax=Streptomyces atratus TaxID=1893 RepID=UPI00325198D8
MNQDVQYGTAVASVYDSLIAPAMPAEEAVDRLRPYVTGARVLEIGVGTGRVAIPVAAIAAEVVGVDNSRPMLDGFRTKGVPTNVSLVEADFRQPLALRGSFDAAYSPAPPSTGSRTWPASSRRAPTDPPARRPSTGLLPQSSSRT